MLLRAIGSSIWIKQESWHDQILCNAQNEFINARTAVAILEALDLCIFCIRNPPSFATGNDVSSLRVVAAWFLAQCQKRVEVVFAFAFGMGMSSFADLAGML